MCPSQAGWQGAARHGPGTGSARMKTRRRVVLGLAGASALVVAVPLALSLLGLLPWSPINCWQYEVDLHSGRIRYTRYLAFIPVSQRIDESALSRALLPDEEQGSQPDWRLVMTLSPGVSNSPHYSFHSAMDQIGKLETLWHSAGASAADRRSSAMRVLELWQEGQCDDAAAPYLRSPSAAGLAPGQDEVAPH